MVGQRDTECPAFVFVTADTGEGWVLDATVEAVP